MYTVFGVHTAYALHDALGSFHGIENWGRPQDFLLSEYLLCTRPQDSGWPYRQPTRNALLHPAAEAIKRIVDELKARWVSALRLPAKENRLKGGWEGWCQEVLTPLGRVGRRCLL